MRVKTREGGGRERGEKEGRLSRHELITASKPTMGSWPGWAQTILSLGSHSRRIAAVHHKQT